MRAVHSCDFCGDDAVGTYDVVPEDLLRTDADQRRVALCSHCYDTLETVLEPFLDGETTETVSTDDAESEPAAASTAEHATTSATSAAVDAEARAEGIAIGRRETGDDADDEDDDTAATSDVARNGQSPSEEQVEAETPDVPPEPDQFRKVMRLLNNREFPVDREGFAELASGAYELGDDHVADIIDYAVDRGVIVDDDGTLRKN